MLFVAKVEVVDGSTVVSFRHNDTALGAAFSISGWTGSKIRPVVSLGSSGQVRELRTLLLPSVLGGDLFGYKKTTKNTGSALLKAIVSQLFMLSCP